MPHITQVACVDTIHKSEFSAYVIPQIPIDAGAEKVTGIVFDGSKLKVKGQEVNALTIRDALKKFLEYLENMNNVVLVAHNGRVFDFRVLSYAINKCGLDQEFVKVVKAFVDSLTVMKARHPKLPSYKQEKLAEHFSLPTYNAHNAVDDVIALDNILAAANCNDAEVMKHSYSSDCHFKQELFTAAKGRNVRSYDTVIAKGIMKMCFAENIAGSGLALGHLKTIFDRNGEDGLMCVFTSKTDGKPRVSSTTKVLENVIAKLCDYFSSL